MWTIVDKNADFFTTASPNATKFAFRKSVLYAVTIELEQIYTALQIFLRRRFCFYSSRLKLCRQHFWLPATDLLPPSFAYAFFRVLGRGRFLLLHLSVAFSDDSSTSVTGFCIELIHR